MAMLKQPIRVETAFDQYTLTELIGEGGAGRVFGGQDSAGAAIAVKLLTNSSTDKRRRFKNEIAFLSRNRHPNIVSVIDSGLAKETGFHGPFYVMPRFEESLRDLIVAGIAPDVAMKLFGQIIDGVEAAHLQSVIHRDLKPENVLSESAGQQLAVADFGIARFTEEHLRTLVETTAASRLANFQYAAPEQRTPGQQVGPAADLYALGLILNELFTGVVPHGTEYRRIGSVAESYGFLDDVVASMIRQNPSDRPTSIAEVKGLISRYRADAVTVQRLDELKKVVVPEGEVTDPLAFEPPRLVSAEHRDGVLKLKLDRPVSRDWVQALGHMGNYRSPMNAGPEAFRFDGADVSVAISGHEAQLAIDCFKEWLPRTTAVLHHRLQQQAIRQKNERDQQLRREREAEEQSLELNRSLRI